MASSAREPHLESLLPSPTAALNAIAPPAYERGTLGGEKAEMNRLATTGSGISQIKSPWARIPLQIADALGRGLFPGIEMGIPGTSGHHDVLMHQQAGRLADVEGGENDAAKREQEAAMTRHTQAETAGLENPQPEYGTPIATSGGLVVPSKQTPEGEPFMVNGEQAQPIEKTATQQNMQSWWRSVHPTGTPEEYRTFENEMKAEGTPEKAAKAKDEFQGAVAKIASEGGLPADALTDVTKLAKHIASSQTLTPEEKNKSLAYLAANTTPAAQGTNTRIRVEGMGAMREYPVIDRETGQLEMRSAVEINANKGKYMPAGQGATAMTKEAVFKDLYFNVDTARKAINGLQTLDAGTRAQLSYALRHSDPGSAMQTFLTGAAATNMTPEQQEFVQSLALLSENAMSLRGVAGMGQGSDDLRAAIQATLPSGKSPSKEYMQGQLNKLEAVITRLNAAVPGTGGASEARMGSGRMAGSGMVHFVDGPDSYDIPPDKLKRFQELHPQAKRQ